MFDNNNNIEYNKDDKINYYDDNKDNNKDKNKDKKNNVIKSYDELIKYVNDRKCQKGEIFSNTWFEEDGNRIFIFNIMDDEYNNFLELYCRALSGDTYGNIHILEKPREKGPLCLDYDFKYMDGIRKFDDEMIRKIIKINNDVIEENYIISDKKIELECYVLIKKEQYYDNDKKIYKDGFHLEYPNLVLLSEDRMRIFELSKVKIEHEGIFKDIEEELIDKMVLDNSVIKRNGWFMFGSGKKKDKKIYPYRLEYILDDKLEKIRITDNLKKIVNKLSIRNKMEIPEIKNKKNINIGDFIISNTDKKEKIKIKYYEEEEEKNKEEKNKEDKNKKINYEDEVEVAKILVKMLSKERATGYNEWIMVGWALYNISEGLIEEFLEFSKLCKEKYDEKYCRKVWIDTFNYHKMRGDNIGYKIASLHRWAKEDNPEEYKKFLDGCINNIMKDMDFKAEFDIALIIREIYRYEYVCTNKKKNIWWEYDGIRWRKIDDGYTLSVKLSTEVVREFANIVNIYNKMAETAQTIMADLYRNKALQAQKLIVNLKSSSFKDKIISECCNLMYDEKFEEKLNSNPKLIGFENGVYDLENMIFRKGTPEDYLTYSTHYKYNDILNMNINNKNIVDKNLKRYITNIENIKTYSKKIKINMEKIKNKIINEEDKAEIMKIITELNQMNKIKIEIREIDENMMIEITKKLIEYFDNNMNHINNIINNKNNKNEDIYKEMREGIRRIREIEEFMEKIQPKEEMRMYILTYMASILEGNNKDQKFLIFTGSGSNGKGTLFELLDNTLGDYYSTVPITLLTQKRKGSSTATPELADKHGKRFLVMQEPETDDKINVGYMKELTGQDKIMARPLYGSPFYYIPQFKIAVACNILPQIPADDNGTWRRLRVADFEQKFCDNPVNANEHKKDTGLREKMKKWNDVFMWLLINKYFMVYNGITLDRMEPEQVKLSTDNYKNDSNIYIEFMDDLYVRDSEGQSLRCFLHKYEGLDDYDLVPMEDINEIKKKFRKWYSKYQNVKKVPKQIIDELKNSLLKSGFKQENNNIYGIKSI